MTELHLPPGQGAQARVHVRQVGQVLVDHRSEHRQLLRVAPGLVLRQPVDGSGRGTVPALGHALEDHDLHDAAGHLAFEGPPAVHDVRGEAAPGREVGEHVVDQRVEDLRVGRSGIIAAPGTLEGAAQPVPEPGPGMADLVGIETRRWLLAPQGEHLLHHPGLVDARVGQVRAGGGERHHVPVHVQAPGVVLGTGVRRHRQDLRVRGDHVVGLHEGFLRHLPVTGNDLRHVRGQVAIFR